MENYIEYFDKDGKLLLKTELIEGAGHNWRVENAINNGLSSFSHYVIRGRKQACMTMEMEYTKNGVAIWREVDDNNLLLPYDGRYDDHVPFIHN